MPGIGGFEAIRIIQTLPLRKPPLIAVCSADSNDNILQECNKLAVKFVQKPVKKEELSHFFLKLQSSQFKVF
jgi:CheY-like chemotaxis protein